MGHSTCYLNLLPPPLSSSPLKYPPTPPLPTCQSITSVTVSPPLPRLLPCVFPRGPIFSIFTLLNQENRFKTVFSLHIWVYIWHVLNAKNIFNPNDYSELNVFFASMTEKNAANFLS